MNELTIYYVLGMLQFVCVYYLIVIVIVIVIKDLMISIQ